MKIEVNYIGHSGFSVGVGSHFLLFDYFFGSFPGKEVNSYKYPVVFASHSHSDHFNQKVFTLAAKKSFSQVLFVRRHKSAPSKRRIYERRRCIARARY